MASMGSAPVRDHTAQAVRDNGGAALFYALSGMFSALFAFVLWYCPRHL
jgi:hypothetical protein